MAQKAAQEHLNDQLVTKAYKDCLQQVVEKQEEEINKYVTSNNYDGNVSEAVEAVAGIPARQRIFAEAFLSQFSKQEKNDPKTRTMLEYAMQAPEFVLDTKDKFLHYVCKQMNSAMRNNNQVQAPEFRVAEISQKLELSETKVADFLRQSIHSDTCKPKGRS